MLIIGNGLIARKFKEVDLPDDFLIFASGVSSSLEVMRAEFEREERLLQKCIESHPEKHILYFSTCSIQSSQETAYTKHKQKMEFLVGNNSARYSIFRVPQLVGEVSNNTLISTIFKAILTNNSLVVHQFAERNLLDIDDLVRIVSIAIGDKVGFNKTKNIASRVNVKVPVLVTEISQLLNIPVKMKLEPRGYIESIDFDYIKYLFGERDILSQENYWSTVINKYHQWYKEKYRY